jgi:ABC-type branched-subunit amino acid transport system permease subunit
LLLRFRYLYMLALGLVLIAVVILFPRGLVADRRRGRNHLTGLGG